MSKELEEITRFAVETVREKLNLEVPGHIDANQPIETVFDLNSMASFAFIVNMEERYGFRVPNADIGKIAKFSLEELSQYLEARIVKHG